MNITPEELAKRIASGERLTVDWAAVIGRLSDANVSYASQNATLQGRAMAAEAMLLECRQFAAWVSERLPEARTVYDKLDAYLTSQGRPAPGGAA